MAGPRWCHRPRASSTGETPGLEVVAVLPVLEQQVLAIDGVRLPAGVGAVEVRVALEHVQQDGIDLIAAHLQAATGGTAHLRDGKGGCHAACGLQRLGELRADLAGVLAAQMLQGLQRIVLSLLADAAGDQPLRRAGKKHAVADEYARRHQQAQPADKRDSVLYGSQGDHAWHS